jgi:8-oxo-dGTP pyrophosphatase MutT (NUDIX family)
VSAPKLAAAIPYRRADGEVEFLLVRTSGGGEERWTFPKGHRKSGESLAEAAAREAREEAGVVGRIETSMLGTYRYPRGPRSEGHADRDVAAFLLDLSNGAFHPEKAEEGRDPTWVDFDRAVALLARSREQPYADEARRILEAASRELDRAT